ncbi:MAG: glycosyltransferase involved in cell wall biosynthesis [Psychroserpens sp.]|jgi:glycosyltransferase involved in cell wall biosynthesis
MNFKVSVIIPAYNAGTFIHKAVSSALEQPQVREVLVIDDGSTDQTKEVLKAIKNKKLRVLTHKNGINKGRSASRNLGLQKATSEYIAFLDADDYYLSHRFDKDEYVFKNNDCDGVYNAIGAFFYRKPGTLEKKNLDITTMTQVIAPENLGPVLVKGNQGRFSIIGLTIKASIIQKIDLFNTALAVAEDTEWIWKAAFKAILLSGNLSEPVAMRGVHDSNTFNQTKLYENYNFKLFKSLYRWSLKEAMSFEVIDLFLERIFILHYRDKHSVFNHLLLWWECMAVHYRVFFSYLALRYFPFIYRWKTLKSKIAPH